MRVNRRQFMQITGAAIITFAGLGKVIRERLFDWGRAPLPKPEGGEEKFVPGVCLQCPAGCGILVRVVGGRAVKIEGNPMHPLNEGLLCPKGQAALYLLYDPDRIRGPLRRVGERGSGRWEPISWEEAIGEVVTRLQEIRQRSEPHTVAFMYGRTRGQMAPLIRRFMTAYGSPNTISNESLSVQAEKTANLLTQGINDLLVYDLDNTNYLLSFGASLLEAWHPTVRHLSTYGHMRRGRPIRGKIVTIDPRLSVTAAKSDEWIPIKPGTDAALALGMAHVMILSRMYDEEFVANHTFGFEDFEDPETGETHKGFKTLVLEEYLPARVSEITDVPVSTIMRIAGEFAANRPKAVAVAKKGARHSGIAGIYNGMAIHCLNALVGNLDVSGGMLVQRPAPCAGWPLLHLDDIAQKGLQQERFDQARSRLFPLAESVYQKVAQNVLERNPYPLNALFLYYTNPAFSAPHGEMFYEAFKEIPFIVDFTPFMSDSAAYADLILPDHTFLERYQDDIADGLGFSVVGLRQPVVEPLYDTRNTGDVILKIAKGLGGTMAESFPWEDFVALLRFRLQALNISWEQLLEQGVWVGPPYEHSSPGDAKWSQIVGRDRKYSSPDGRFDFYSRELRCTLASMNITAQELEVLGLIAQGDEIFLPHYEPPDRAGDEANYPLLLNTYKLMAHAEGRGANVPLLQNLLGPHLQERWGSWVEINPETAHHLGIADGDEVWVESPLGRIKTKARLYPGTRPEVVNMPFERGHIVGGRWAKGRGVNPNKIMAPRTGNLAGLASFTSTRVKVYKA